MTTWSDYPAREYVTEISVPDFGDGGIQRLHSKPLAGKGERAMPSSEIENPNPPVATVHPVETWAHNQAVQAAEAADGFEADGPGA